jgi:hypothetical protein
MESPDNKEGSKSLTSNIILTIGLKIAGSNPARGSKLLKLNHTHNAIR